MNFVDDISHAGPKRLSALFLLSMWWRILYGILRLILGVTLLRLIGEPIADLMYTLMSHELSGPRSDIVLERLYELMSVHGFTVTYFVAGYFIFWGTIDVVLSVYLLRHKLVAFPISMVLIGLFIAYSVLRFFHTHSFTLLCVIVIDIFILSIIYREYRLLQREHDLVTLDMTTPPGPPHHQS